MTILLSDGEYDPYHIQHILEAPKVQFHDSFAQVIDDQAILRIGSIETRTDMEVMSNLVEKPQASQIVAVEVVMISWSCGEGRMIDIIGWHGRYESGGGHDTSVSMQGELKPL